VGVAGREGRCGQCALEGVTVTAILFGRGTAPQLSRRPTGAERTLVPSLRVDDAWCFDTTDEEARAMLRAESDGVVLGWEPAAALERKGRI
jgi:hypothetical protein